jgi:hypothetical protein
MTRTAWLAALLLTTGATAPVVRAALAADTTAVMTVTVAPRSKFVFLDGPIDAGAPDRLSKAFSTMSEPIAVGLNSAGGNLFAGMQLGRIIRERGASTHIRHPRTLLPGECYSACALAFLGGVHRFSDNGARYGVHRASFPVDRSTGAGDLSPELSAAIGSYMREMGVDARLLDLWQKAAPDEMYVLSPREARDLRVISDGRERPEWSLTSFPGGTMLQGRQVTTDGPATVYFSCDDKQTIFGSVSRVSDNTEPAAVRRWRHVATVDSYPGVLLTPLAVSIKDGVVRTTFVVTPDVVRLVMSATRIGHLMTPTSEVSPIGVSVDVDESSALMVRTFLGSCLRRQAKK